MAREHVVANGDSGIFIGGSTTSNLIGGTTASSRNVISGNSQYGVYIAGTNTSVLRQLSWNGCQRECCGAQCV